MSHRTRSVDRMNSIVLHIGIHKTATTSMQEFFLEHQHTLAKNQVRYIPLKQMREHLTPLINHAVTDSTARQQLSEELNAQQDKTLLLSDENIIGTPGEITRHQLYMYAEARVTNLIQAVSPRQVHLFLTLREPSEFLVSLYSEFLRHRPFLPFKKYVGSVDLGSFSFARTLGWVRSLPTNATLHVLPFEPSLGGGLERVTSMILNAACANSQSIDASSMPKTRSRSSFTQEEIQLFEKIHTAAGARAVKDFVNMIERRGHRFGRQRYQPLPSGTALKMATRYRSDLAWLSSASKSSSAALDTKGSS